jgi:hypothetical protein
MATLKINTSYPIGFVIAADIFAVLGPDALTYCLMGIIGSMIGSFVRIVKRDEADLDNKYNFFYLKDVFVLITWALVGGFFPLVFAVQGWPPLVAVICSPFTPKFWDVMELFIPGILKTVLDKFYPGQDKDKDKDKKKEIEQERISGK